MASFESTVDTHEMVILDFWAEWCGPCKAFAPIFEAASERYPEVFFGKVNTEIAVDLTEAFVIRSIPTLMAFKKGELVFEQPGLLPVNALDALVQQLKELEIKPASDSEPDEVTG